MKSKRKKEQIKEKMLHCSKWNNPIIKLKCETIEKNCMVSFWLCSPELFLRFSFLCSTFFYHFFRLLFSKAFPFLLRSSHQFTYAFSASIDETVPMQLDGCKSRARTTHINFGMKWHRFLLSACNTTIWCACARIRLLFVSFGFGIIYLSPLRWRWQLTAHNYWHSKLRESNKMHCARLKTSIERKKDENKEQNVSKKLRRFYCFQLILPFSVLLYSLSASAYISCTPLASRAQTSFWKEKKNIE